MWILREVEDDLEVDPMGGGGDLGNSDSQTDPD